LGALPVASAAGEGAASVGSLAGGFAGVSLPAARFLAPSSTSAGRRLAGAASSRGDGAAAAVGGGSGAGNGRVSWSLLPSSLQPPSRLRLRNPARKTSGVGAPRNETA